MRLIDADALKETFEIAYKEARHDIEYANAFFSDAGAVSTEWWCVEDMVDNAPTIEPQKWIPCSERLPELYKPVLVTGGDVIWICELIESPDLDDGEFQWEDKMLGHWYSFDNWDAWMPLPPAYKGDE